MAPPNTTEYTAAVVDEHSTGPIKTDEDDFKMLQTRSLDDMFDESFRDFAKWMRNHYTKKYPIPKMREINKSYFVKLVIATILSVAIYAVFRIYFFNYVWLWFLPMMFFNIVFVTKYQEIAHIRTHWTTNMTGSPALDRFIDKVMVPFTGMSKETYRRRHVSAHYADVANMARVFSDVWLPFITFPPVYYARPWGILSIIMDVDYCKKQKLNRTQLAIEAVGLYCYMFAMFAEIYYFASFYLLFFHLCPLVIYQGSVVASASFAHSGIDKRNSFNSNGIFDADALPASQALLAISIRVIAIFGNYAVYNHGVHHAFTQLPLKIVNQDYKFINKHVLEGNYKHVRYNKLMFHDVFAPLYARIPAPQWYDKIIQTFVAVLSVVGYSGTVLGFSMFPNMFEPLLIDYRIFFWSTKEERSACLLSLWETLHLMDFKKNVAKPNAYLALTLKNFDYHKGVVDNYEAKTGKKLPRPDLSHYDQEILQHLWKLQSNRGAF